MNKIINSITLTSSLILLLCSCGGYREVDSLTVLSAIGIDATKDGIKFTGEIVVPKQGTTELTSYFISSEGLSFYDALTNAVGKVNENLYLSHTEVFLIDEATAKAGITQLISDFIRDNGVRLSSYIFISQNTSSQEMLKLKQDDVVSGTELMDKFERAKVLSYTIDTPIYKLSQQNYTSILPVVRQISENGKSSYEISGGAIIENGKLIDYITAEQSLALNILQNSVLGGIFKDNYDNIFKIDTSKTNITPKVLDGQITFIIDTHLTLDLMHTEHTGYIISQTIQDELETDAYNYIYSQLTSLINFAKYGVNVDFLGFDRLLYSKIPDFYSENQNNYKKLFEDMSFDLNLSIKLTQSGLIMTGKEES